MDTWDRSDLHGQRLNTPYPSVSQPVLVRKSMLPSALVRRQSQIRFDPALRLHMNRTVGNHCLVEKTKKKKGSEHSVFHAAGRARRIRSPAPMNKKPSFPG